MLSANNATMRFGGLTAVTDLNIRVEDREIVGLIGPNGGQDDRVQHDHRRLSTDRGNHRL